MADSDVVDNETGKLSLQKSSNLIPIRDTERARDLQKRSVESRLRRRAISQLEALRGVRIGIQEVEGDKPVKTWRDAWRILNGAVAQSAYEGDARALLALGKTTGLTETDKHSGGDGMGNQTTVIIGDDVARAWFDRYRRDR